MVHSILKCSSTVYGFELAGVRMPSAGQSYWLRENAFVVVALVRPEMGRPRQRVSTTQLTCPHRRMKDNWNSSPGYGEESRDEDDM